jgi:prolyl oligopeptidase
VDARSPAKREIVVPQGPHVMDTMSLAADGLYFHGYRGQVGGLKRYTFATGRIDDVPLPREGAVWEVKACPTRDGAWFGMDSLTWPAIIFKADAQLKVTDTGLFPLPPFDTSPFTTTRLEIKARDGTMVPIEIMHRTDAARDGRRPVLIQAYGSYGLPLDPGFQPPWLAFLEQGGVMVLAHVRGGGEKGEDWHRAGMKATKPNTWRDAIDVAEALIRMKWTSKRHLALWGTSAGGIMVGRAITERPDLFRVAIGEVGAFNTLRFELTANGPGNDLEFGTVKKQDEFGWLREMDAYHHVKAGVKYPAALFITGANDARVEPWQIAKMAARMQRCSASGRAVLLRVDYSSGHYATTRAAGVLKYTDIFAFLLGNMG